MHALLSSSPLALALLSGALGLLVGSFLNVVGHRLPIIMERRWARECAEFNDAETQQDDQVYNLTTPRSACPACGHNITAMENIPILSYLFLRGKCRGCGIKISPQYPVVEAVTGLLSVFVAWHFGYGWQTLAALFFTWTLIALTIIDLKKQLLPDSITLPLLWAGLIINLGHVFTDIESSILGAVFGYLSLWSVYHLFRLLTGKEGMGYGDFKLLAALGAWLGWQSLPIIIIFSSLVGAVVGITMILFKRQQQGQPIPFGPFLAVAGWLTMIWGKEITDAYMRFSGLA
ncbi:MAG TPA: prepilin peptidase [Chromatiales bacterium]|nr:prepilin peptidase [Thiotrichales bacterium]HIP68730.1 prepilin peptidase [Chromatiales bacterium]